MNDKNRSENFEKSLPRLILAPVLSIIEDESTMPGEVFTDLDTKEAGKAKAEVAKLVKLSEAQDIEARDGTTCDVVMTGSLLDASSKLLDKGIHSSTVSESHQHASAKAVEILNSMAIPIELNDGESLLKSATTALSSKSRLSPVVKEAILGKDYETLSHELYDTMQRESDLREQLKFSEEEAKQLRRKIIALESKNETLMMLMKKLTAVVRTRSGKKDEDAEEEELSAENLNIHLDLQEQEMGFLRRKLDETEKENENLQPEVKYFQEKVINQPLYPSSFFTWAGPPDPAGPGTTGPAFPSSFGHMPEDSSDSEDSEHSHSNQCGECPGCLRQEDCMECEVCLKKMDDPDLDVICILRECTGEEEKDSRQECMKKNAEFKTEAVERYRYRLSKILQIIKDIK